MKKILLSLLLFILLPSVALASSKTVIFNVSFEDASYMDNIEKIYVNYTDRSETEYSVTLEKANNFYYSYNEYDGTDIEKVNVSFDNPSYKGTSSVIKGTNEYNISINVEKDNSSNEEIFIGGNTQPTTTTTNPITQTTTSNTYTTTVPTTTKTSVIESGLLESQAKSNKIIKTIFMVFVVIALIVVVIFALHAIIKIVNANK